MKRVKQIYTAILLVTAVLLLPAPAWGQTLTSSGTWQATTITGGETVTLTGDVTIDGCITIGNESGTPASLTIRNSANREVTIKRSRDAIMMFRLYYGSTLRIEGQDGRMIVLDGGANLSWDDSGWKDRKEKRWTECRYTGTDYNYIPLKGGNPSDNVESMILTYGTLNLDHVCIQNLNAGNKNKYPINITEASNKINVDKYRCGSTTLTNCTIQKCRAARGSAIFVGYQGNNEENTPTNCAVTLNNVTITQCMVNPEHKNLNEMSKEGEAWGGVIRFSGRSVSNLTMINCTMKQNYSTGDGSCLWWNAGGDGKIPPKLTLNGCRFEDNRSDRDAGAVRLESGFEFTGAETVFSDNSCGRYGGAVQVADYNGDEGAVAARSFSYNLSEKLKVENNCAGDAGGGIAFYYIADKLDDGFTFNVNLNGMKIMKNRAGVRGGGIIFTDLRTDVLEDVSKNYNFHVYLNSGTITGNSAVKGGGGIFARKFTITTNTLGGEVEISENEVTAADAIDEGGTGGGGGIAVYDGTLNLNTCKITNNTVTAVDDNLVSKGYGGGVLLNRSNFNMTGTNTISGNTANMGGGVAVLNNTDVEKVVTMTVGNITGNTARLAGGGMAVVGYTEVKIIGVNISNNKAVDGGGVFMQGRSNQQANAGQTVVTYKEGQISGNEAVAKEGESEHISSNTAFRKEIDKVWGMGGGLYLSSNSKLELLIDDRSALGIGNNTALNGADDVFCNGAEGTVVVLPGVAAMSLEGAEKLFWVEDYITNDTEYRNGTNVNESWDNDNLRYKDAVNTHQINKVFRLSQPQSDGTVKYSFTAAYEGGSQKIYEVFENKYMCLTLGTVATYIILQKKGMEARDNAIFRIYRWDIDDGETIPTDLSNHLFMTLILTDGDKAGDLRSKRIDVDYGYFYLVEETPWSWAYDVDAEDRRILREVKRDSDIDNRTFTFTNTPKSDTPKHAESVKVNKMPG